MADNPPPTVENITLDKTIVKLLGFKADGENSPEKAIPYSTSDYLELVDWSGRAIIEGKKNRFRITFRPSFSGCA
ncbi:MAG: hypothetical protein LC637_10680 [Xanthomonadaceae bacterium]|nr:hypothetical protein [Xanthomonadaceae bacterium]